jgi:predicted amidohydrolase YtcJ
MRRALRLLLVCSFTALLVGSGGQGASAHSARPADLVLRGGGVYTLDAARSWAQAVAVQDGHIVAVGSDHAVGAWIGPHTKLVDLEGHMLLPGFHDAHSHPSMGGLDLLGCSLRNATTLDAVLDTLRGCAAKTPGDGWLYASELNQALLPGANGDKAMLDAIAADRPIYVACADGHSAWVNSKSLEIGGITRETPDPPASVIARDPVTGEPSGMLREAAMNLVSAHMPPKTKAERIEGLRRAVQMANRFGITSLIDAAVGEAEMATYKALEDRGELSVRALLCMEWGTHFQNPAGEQEALLTRRSRYEGPRIHTNSIKLFVDGVLEGETAALLEPYLDTPGKRGPLNFSPEQLATWVVRFDAENLQVHMHAIGDRAVRVALDAVAAARAANGARDNRHHIAHLQLIHPDDLPRFAALGVLANFQALWAYPDTYITKINLPAVGPERVARMYPIESAHRAGAVLVGGSDWNVSSMNPLEAIQVALTREDPNGVIQGVLNPDERVDLDVMLAAYTINGAYLMHQEHELGSIEVGKLADLVLLDRNLFLVPDHEIGGVAVLQTWIDGEPVYTAPARR